MLVKSTPRLAFLNFSLALSLAGCDLRLWISRTGSRLARVGSLPLRAKTSLRSAAMKPVRCAVLKKTMTLCSSGSSSMAASTISTVADRNRSIDGSTTWLCATRLLVSVPAAMASPSCTQSTTTWSE